MPRFRSLGGSREKGAPDVARSRHRFVSVSHARFAQDNARFDSAPGRRLLAVAVLGSGIAFLECAEPRRSVPTLAWAPD